MRELHKYELDFVSGGDGERVIVTHSRDGNPGHSVSLSSIAHTSTGPSSGGIGGGGGSRSQPVVVPLVQQQCVDTTKQVCTTGGGVTNFSFGLSGVSMTRTVPKCETEVTTTCTSGRASSR